MALKSRFPAEVTKADASRLTMPNLKTMLEFMGVSLSQQPKGKQQKVDMLRERIKSEPVKAQAAYDVIVLGKLPEADKKVVMDAEAMKAHFMGVMERLLESEQMDKIRDTLGEITGRIEEKLASSAKAALAEASKNYRPVVVKQGGKTTKVEGVMPEQFERIVQLASQRVPVMMVGPAGCGKTFVAEKVADALKLKFYDQSCSEGVSESTFAGWLLPTGASGKFQYVSSPFIEAYEKGGVFLLDEIDAADPNLLTFLNKAIANQFFFLPQRFGNPMVKKHKDFVVIAAANTFGRGADAQYVGRNALDAATLDRYRAGMVYMDYSEQVEETLIDSEVLRWGRAVRAVIAKNKLRKIMSTRVMLDFTKLKLNCEWTLKECEEAFFADWSESELQFWKPERAKFFTENNLNEQMRKQA